MPKGLIWTPQQIEYLQEHWDRSDESLAKNLHRTAIAVRMKAKRLKLGAKQTDTLSMREIAEELKVCFQTVKKLNIPYAHSNTCGKFRIQLTDLYTFLKNNNDKIDLRHLSLDYSFNVATPNWLKVLILQRRKSIPAQRRYSVIEERRLKYLLKTGIPYREIAVKMNRTESSVSHRVLRMSW